MAREKMHKEMVPPGRIFMRSTCGSFVGIGENCVENAGKFLVKIYCLYVKTNKKSRKKLAASSVENTEKLLAISERVCYNVQQEQGKEENNYEKIFSIDIRGCGRPDLS